MKKNVCFIVVSSLSIYFSSSTLKSPPPFQCWRLRKRITQSHDPHDSDEDCPCAVEFCPVGTKTAASANCFRMIARCYTHTHCCVTVWSQHILSRHCAVFVPETAPTGTPCQQTKKGPQRGTHQKSVARPERFLISHSGVASTWVVRRKFLRQDLDSGLTTDQNNEDGEHASRGHSHRRSAPITRNRFSPVRRVCRWSQHGAAESRRQKLTSLLLPWSNRYCGHKRKHQQQRTGQDRGAGHQGGKQQKGEGGPAAAGLAADGRHQEPEERTS